MRKKQGYNKLKLLIHRYKICMCLLMKVRSLFIQGNGKEETANCHICGKKGKIVDDFPQKAYGKRGVDNCAEARSP